MVAIDAKTRAVLMKKERLFDATKSRTKERIMENVRMAIEKLQAAERELLDDVDIEFGENPFADFLSNEGDHTEEEVRSILSKEIPSNFGPSEESFCSLLKEIESFRSWQKKKKNEEKISPFKLIPQNLRCTSLTSSSATLMWDKVDCDCIYEIGLKAVSLGSDEMVYNSFEPTLTLHDLEQETKYFIHVRTVTSQNVGNCIWSNPVSIQTKNSFTDCVWMKCPDYVDENRKYSVDGKNLRIATKIGDGWSTIIGNTPLPLNKVVSWSIKVLKSRDNDGSCIDVGVAPSDINQNEDDTFKKCGWYFGCYGSRLWSGPPHYYDTKEYGPRKGRKGQYIHTGDTVSVVMDTAKGELSFALNGVNLGVAYEGIPLDKPLVPCVLLWYIGDSVELII